METDHEDDDYNPTDDGEEETSGYTFRRRSSGDVVTAARANSTRKKPRTDSNTETSRICLPTDQKACSAHLQHLRK